MLVRQALRSSPARGRISAMSVRSDMPSPELESEIRRDLEAGEKVVWTGTPDASAFARGRWFHVPFGLFFAGFAVFWMAAPYLLGAGTKNGAHPPLAFTLFGVPFVVVGLGMASSPLWMRRKAARSAYVITDRRAIVIEGGVFSNSKTTISYAPERLRNIARIDRRGDRGDLVFEQVSMGYQQNNQQAMRPRGFLGIQDVREVEKLLRSTLRIGT